MRLSRRLVILICLGLVTAACGGTGEATTTTNSAAPTTNAPSSSTTPSSTSTSTADTTATIELTQTVEGALAVKDQFFAAYNDGMVDDTMALFAPNARVVSYIGRTCTTPGASCSNIDEFRTLITFDMAQEAEWNATNCTAEQWSRMLSGERTLQDAIQIVCDVTYQPFLYRALGAEVHGTLQFVVADDLVTELGNPTDGQQFRDVEVPFHGWVGDTHPDDLDRMYENNWRSLVLTVESAELRNEYAEEYAATLAD